MTVRTARAALFLVSVLIWHSAAAQKQPAPQKPATDAPKPGGEKKPGRMFGILPALNVIDTKSAPPMTSGQKFHLAIMSTIDPTAFVGAGIKAGIYQASNFPPGFGHGASGYGKRYAAAFGDGASGKLLRIGVFPSLLHQDPRYFRKSQGSVPGRLGYALSRTLVTRTDAGGRAFNWSRILGSFGSAALSDLYYPQENSGAKVTFVNVGYSLLGEAGSNSLKEFWPDIQRKLRRNK